MFLPLYLLVITKIFFTVASNGGSTLFSDRFIRTKCWSEVDIAKLRARKLFEQIVPLSVTPQRINSRFIRGLLHYYRHALQSVENDNDKQTSLILREALADTIGGHLRSEILPTARLAYYAGYVPYVKVKELHDFYDNIRKELNTQGLGWKRAERISEWSNLTVAKIIIGDGKYFHPCASLVLKRDSSSCMHISSPILDDELVPSAMELPLKTGGLVSLTSPISENILMKYYTTASRCILSRSPAACRHSDFVNFNNDMWHWMKRHVAPHVMDEKLYAAYGGVFRIAAAVQSYGRGLSRRNLLDIQSTEISKWQPWKTLKDTYVYVNTDWTPHLYVGVVILAGISICLMQMCYNFILGDEDCCTYPDRSNRETVNNVEYANTESNIPAMLPSHQSAVLYSDAMHTKDKVSKNKTPSLGSLHTQKVFDLNENEEKLMAVITSDKSSSNEGTESTGNGEESGSVSDASDEDGKRSLSPPKIETDVSQIHLSKRANSTHLYSASSATKSDRTYRQRTTDSNWTGSSSTEQSISSTTSKSRCRQSRSSRDLAWARRVVSKHPSQRKSTSGTELCGTSFTTPPSGR